MEIPSQHQPVATMTNDERLNRVEDQVIDIRLAVSALLDTVTLHQRNFDTIVQELRGIRTDMRDLQTQVRDLQTQVRDIQVEVRDIQTDVRGLQTENRRILDILQNRQGTDEA